jgi:two-component system chemotaxis response regulator CheB
MARGGHDIIVIGGSAGSLQPLLEIVGALSTDINAAVFIVVHRSSELPSMLADILTSRCALPVVIPSDQEMINLAKVYVTGTDHHLMIKGDEVRVIKGPKENGFRPAIDPLFRTAAASYGNRVIGVVLSGTLDDGSHGLWKVKEAGGIAIVQDPDEAQFSEMPLSAVRQLEVDYILPAAEIGLKIQDLVDSELELTLPHPQSAVDVSEGLIDALRLEDLKKSPTPFVCPDCGGTLWEIDGEAMPRYRCHVGHGFTAEILSKLQSADAEKLLWGAIRMLEEQADLQRRLAKKWHSKSDTVMEKRFASGAIDAEDTADLLRSITISSAAREVRRAHHTDMEKVKAEYDG